MSFAHYMYIGFFEHEGNIVRFSNTVADPVLKPVVSRALDMDVIKRLVRECDRKNGATGNLPFPADWAIWVEDGYLAANEAAMNPEAIDFVTRLVRETGCTLVDFNARSFINVDELSSYLGTTEAIASH